MAKIMKLLLVEDDANLGKSLAQGFSESGFSVLCATTLKSAKTILASEPVQIVVLDLGLPDGSGQDLLQTLKMTFPATPVIITTARGELDDRLRGLQGGADDYLVKPYAFVELLARVRNLLRRSQPRSPEVWRVGDLEVDTVPRRATRGGELIELTPREYDLLMKLVRAQGAVVTREMLAREVWQQQAWTPSLDNAMDVHMSRLREKLDKNRPKQLIQTVRGVGYVLRERA
jgi:two-component system, OmpR family, copper resistance phosphate regulon response regulator CusR